MPNTLNEAVKYLLDQIPESEVRKILKKDATADWFKAMYHHGFIKRHHLRLWDEKSDDLRADIWENCTSEEKTRFNQHWMRFGQGGNFIGKNMHADDASAIVMDRLWHAAKEKYE